MLAVGRLFVEYGGPDKINRRRCADQQDLLSCCWSSFDLQRVKRRRLAMGCRSFILLESKKRREAFSGKGPISAFFAFLPLFDSIHAFIRTHPKADSYETRRPKTELSCTSVFSMAQTGISSFVFIFLSCGVLREYAGFSFELGGRWRKELSQYFN